MRAFVQRTGFEISPPLTLLRTDVAGGWAFRSRGPSASWRRIWRGNPGAGKSHGEPRAQRAGHMDQT